MGRPKKGWTVRFREGRDAELRFTHKGRQEHINLGTRDRGEAYSKAPTAYAEFIERAARTPEQDTRELIAAGKRSFASVGAEWLAEVAPKIREGTLDTYEVYVGTLDEAFDSIESATESAIETFIERRLAKVLRATLKHELSTLTRILRYSVKKAYLSAMPKVPRMPEGEDGTKCGKHRVKAAWHTHEEVLALIAELPEWSRRNRKDCKRHPIRARFQFSYAMPIRPTTVDLLEVPTHWDHDRESIWIPDEDDKTSNGREIPLPPDALEALRSVAPAKGVIFGHHDYREALRNAATKAKWPQHKIDRLCGQHFRSAGGTYLLEISNNNLLGVGYILGHTQVTTTARYMRPNERAGSQVIALTRKARTA